MKQNRLNQQTLQTSSKRHRLIWDLVKSAFKHNKTYQEYPVNKLKKGYHNGRDRFDIVILDLKVVIEVHGEQHYRPVQFGGISMEEATLNYNVQVNRDKDKKDACEDVGFAYISIPYDEEVSSDVIVQKVKEAVRSREPSDKANTFRKEKVEESEFTRELKEKAKAYRRKAYQEAKKRYKERKLHEEGGME